MVTAPVIDTLDPASPAAGTRVTIIGSGFGTRTAGSDILFGGFSALSLVEAWENNRIVVTVPHTVSSASDVQVVTPAGASASVAFQRTFSWRGFTPLQDGPSASFQSPRSCVDPRPENRADVLVLYTTGTGLLYSRRFDGAMSQFTSLPPGQGQPVYDDLNTLVGPYDVTLDPQGRGLAVFPADGETVPFSVLYSRYDPATDTWAVTRTGLQSADATFPNTGGKCLVRSWPDGSALCVFDETSFTTGEARVMARRWDGTRQAWDTTAIRLDDPAQVVDKKLAALAVDERGRATCLFIQAGTGVVARRYDPAGGWGAGSWGPRVVLNTRPLADDGAGVAMDASGNAVAAFTENGAGTQWVMTSRYSATLGNWQANPEQLSSSGVVDPNHSPPVVGFDGTQAAIALFSDQVNVSGVACQALFARRREPGDTGAWGPAAEIDGGPDRGVSAWFANLAFAPGGGTGAAVFIRKVAGGASRVAVNRYDAISRVWSGATDVDTGGAVSDPGVRIFPWIMADPWGNLGVLWGQNDTTAWNYYH